MYRTIFNVYFYFANDTHKENVPSNKTKALMKSSNMCICEIATYVNKIGNYAYFPAVMYNF